MLIWSIADTVIIIISAIKEQFESFAIATKLTSALTAVSLMLIFSTQKTQKFKHFYFACNVLRCKLDYSIFNSLFFASFSLVQLRSSPCYKHSLPLSAAPPPSS